MRLLITNLTIFINVFQELCHCLKQYNKPLLIVIYTIIIPLLIKTTPKKQITMQFVVGKYLTHYKFNKTQECQWIDSFFLFLFLSFSNMNINNYSKQMYFSLLLIVICSMIHPALRKPIHIRQITMPMLNREPSI